MEFLTDSTKCWCGNIDLLPFSPGYLKCPACETLVVAQMPGANITRVTDDGQDFYGREYWFSLQDDLGFPNIKVRSRTDLPERCLYWLRTVLKYKLPPGRVLELGSGHGGFVAMLNWVGFDATGLELSPWVVESAKDTFGVPMLLGPVEDQQIEPGSLDLIALMDVLEHLPDPVGTMSHCLNLLKPDGILAIQTPCLPEGKTYEDLVAQDDPFIKMLIEQNHLYLFSQRSISEFFQRLGAKHLTFELAIFAHYDMFLVVSRTPLTVYSPPDIESALGATPGGRLVQAALDLDGQFHESKRRYAELEADRAAKDETIARLIDELEAVRADRAAKDKVITRLIDELEAVRTDQSAKEEAIARLQAMLKIKQAMLEAREAVISKLGVELSEYKSLGWGLAHAIVASKHWLRRRQAQQPAISHDTVPKVPTAQANTARPHVLHVALDVIQIQFGVSGGIEIYMKTLVRALTGEANQEVRLTLLCTPDQVPHLQAKFGDQVSYHAFGCEPTVSLLVAARNTLRGKRRTRVAAYANISFARLDEAPGIDILHSPVQIFSQRDFTVPGVLNLHDLQHLHYPENFTARDLEARNRLYGQSAALASAIIASSDFVRQDIIERMGIPASKVYTIPVAFNPDVEQGLRTFTPEQARHTYHLPETFGFYPAQFWIHKNHARLIEALAIVRARAPQHDFKLVFTGYRGLSGWPLVEQALDTHNMRDHVLLLDYVPTEHLGAIYRLATFCVAPSLFEASSYPAIEAQWLGCPAMCSNVTSLPELMADGAGLLFDPLSAEDMADKMLRWLNDPADRLAHAERGRRRAQRCHSLTAYAANILDLYKKVLDLHTTAKRGYM